MENPKISVLMTTYNPNFEYLKQALDSIYMQTYNSYEVILVDDGSQADVRGFLERQQYRSIHYIRLEENQGITKALNVGLKKCKGEYIARMDDDDISEVDRLEKQIRYLEDNKEINILGTNKRNFGENVNISDITINQLSREEQQVELFFSNIGVPHPTVMIRKEFLDKNGIVYNENYKKSQDYGLWVECSRYSKIYCLSEPLLRYRCHNKQISSMSSDEQMYYKNKIRFDQLEKLGIKADNNEKELHLAFCADVVKPDELHQMLRWIRKLYSGNRKENYFKSDIFEYRLFIKGYTNLKECHLIIKIFGLLYIFKLKFIFRYLKKYVRGM